MSLWDIYKAKRLGTAAELFFDTALGEKLGGSYEPFIDKVPYVKRKTAGGADVAPKCNDTVVGGTVAWNQKLINPTFDSSYKWTSNRGILDISDNTAIVTPSSDNTEVGIKGGWGDEKMPLGHKVLLSIEVKCTKQTQIGICIAGADAWSTRKPTIPANVWQRVSCMWTSSVGDYGTFYATAKNTLTTSDQIRFRNAQAFDLTEMFGSTIAEAIYALEQASEGAGVAVFRKLFPNEVYSQNDRSLQSVNTSAHITKDENETVIGNYTLDESLTLRGIVKMENGKPYYDGDSYESDGTVTRKYGVRAYQSGDSTDGSTMVTDGINTVYKLDIPTTESAEPFTNPQKVKANGYEEYVDYSVLQNIRDVSIPVGHVTEYKVRSEA